MIRARRMSRIRRRVSAWQITERPPSTRLRLAALGAAATVTWLSLGGPIWSAAASSPPAPVTAWWTTANLGSGVAVPGALLGASGKQLAVEGSNALPPVSGVSTAPLSSLAVAGIRWQLPAGVVPVSLSLSFAGSPPPFTSVQACRATSSFTSVYGGPYADVPSYSCANAVDGVVKSGKLTFAGIAKLASGRTLSVMLLPGPLDRAVFDPPSLTSLAITAAPTTHRPPPAGVGGSVGRGAPPPPAGGSGSPGAPGPLPSIPSAPQTSPLAGGPPPVVAGSGQAAQPVALTEFLPRWHRWLAGTVIGLEAAIFLATRRPEDDKSKPPRGIGRFTADRDAPPMSL